MSSGAGVQGEEEFPVDNCVLAHWLSFWPIFVCIMCSSFIWVLWRHFCQVMSCQYRLMVTLKDKGFWKCLFCKLQSKLRLAETSETSDAF